MNRPRNATDLFELRRKEKRLPDSSESFWTTLFGLFLLHVAKNGSKGSELQVWRCSDSHEAPWFEPRRNLPPLDLTGLDFDSLTVEPIGKSMSQYFWTVAKVPLKIARFEPDLVLEVSGTQQGGNTKYIFIENKTEGPLQRNQTENYPQLINYLSQKGVGTEFLLLVSVGNRKVYTQAKHF